MSTSLTHVETGIRGGLLAVLIAVWLTIVTLAAALLLSQVATINIDRARVDQTLSTLLPDDPATQSELVP